MLALRGLLNWSGIGAGLARSFLVPGRQPVAPIATRGILPLHGRGSGLGGLGFSISNLFLAPSDFYLLRYGHRASLSKIVR